MSIWKKLAAATAELSMGRPIGALLDSGASHEHREPQKQDNGPENEVPFTVGVIALGAKMAKADGSVSSDEIAAFKEAFKVSAGEMRQAAPIFNSAKQDATDFESCATQLSTLFAGNRKLLEDVLDGLFHIAKADDEVHPQEEQFLGRVAELFGFKDDQFSWIRARHVAPAKRNPYEVLGVEPSISDEELKSHYLALVAENRPDKLIARGVPQEFIIIATERHAALSAAYDAILKERAG
jgi:DnaJ like chaperone protein